MTSSEGTGCRRLAELCKALSHPARIEILNHLLREDRCICGELVAVLPLAQSTVSQHLKVLKASGLVQGEVEGPKTCYCVDKVVLEEFKRLVGGMAEGEWLKVWGTLPSYFDSRAKPVSECGGRGMRPEHSRAWVPRT